jgi:hypothetical protein
MQKWEYLRIRVSYPGGNIFSQNILTSYIYGSKYLENVHVDVFHSRIDELGNDGWELVNVTATRDGESYWFKRPKE